VALWIQAKGQAAKRSGTEQTSTISITVRARRASLNAMKPRIQCVPAQ
jgi:hypothetical protein